MIETLITVVIILLIFYVIWWAISQIPLPEPWGVVVRVIFALILALVLLSLLTDVSPIRLDV